MNLPAGLLARIERAAEDQGVTPAELLEVWLQREERERDWQAFLLRGQQRGAAHLPADADEATVNDLVNARIEESRRDLAR
jgi:hypothetical protein